MLCVTLINPVESLAGFVESCKNANCNIKIIFDPYYAKKYKSIYQDVPSITIDKITKEKLIDHLSKIKKENESVLIIGCHDNIQIDIALSCSELEIPYSSLNSINACRNKFRLRKLLQGHDRIEFGDITKSNEDILPPNYPVICKPKLGWGSNWAEKICNDDEFLEYKERTASLYTPSEYSQWFYGEILENGFFWEKWVDGPVITAELFLDNDRMFVPMLSIAHQFPGTCFGAGTMIPFAPSKKNLINIENTIRSIITLTKINHGVFDIEMKLTDFGIHVIDINPRPMGGEMIRAFNTVSNVSFSDLYIDFFVSNNIPKITYSNYSATHKVMCNDVISESNILEHLNRTDAIIYINQKSFPLEPDTILARYITESSDPIECMDMGYRIFEELIFTNSIKKPDYRSTKEVITTSQKSGPYRICGSIVSFNFNTAVENLRKEDSLQESNYICL